MALNSQQVHALIKAYDIRGIVPDQLDSSIAYTIGFAFAELMKNEDAKSIVIGHDMRPSSPELSASFSEGVMAAGLNVKYIGLISTDGLYYAAGYYHCPGAMFTASHNPAEYNGIKLCRAGAKPVGEGTGLEFIAEFLEKDRPIVPAELPGTMLKEEILDAYTSFLLDATNLSSIRPLKIVVDAGNGMAGCTAPAVFDRIKNLEYIPMYFELDGSFPNHEANPIDPANLVDLQARVLEEKADLGLAFDGDADRCFFVDEKGQGIPPSAITALVAVQELAKHPSATILYNAVTSRAVPEIVAEHGGTAIRTRVGHSFIKRVMAEQGAIFGGEHSAHYYFADFFGADSGMLAGLYVLSALGAENLPASELMSTYLRYPQSGEINSKVDNAQATIEKIVTVFADRTESTDSLDGVSVYLQDGLWFNLRASNTEPLLRLNAEGRSQAEVDALVQELLAIIRG